MLEVLVTASIFISATSLAALLLHWHAEREWHWWYTSRLEEVVFHLRELALANGRDAKVTRVTWGSP